MPAKSEEQRKAAGIALSAKRGETDPDELFGAAKEMYKSMSKEELEKYASKVEEFSLPGSRRIKIGDLVAVYMTPYHKKQIGTAKVRDKIRKQLGTKYIVRYVSGLHGYDKLPGDLLSKIRENKKMNKSELRKIIREEVKKFLKEGLHEKNVIEWAVELLQKGYNYEDVKDMVKHSYEFSNNVVNRIVDKAKKIWRYS